MHTLGSVGHFVPENVDMRTSHMQCFSISGQDNDSEMWPSCDLIDTGAGSVPHCSVCGIRFDAFLINPAFRLRRRTFDLSFTYDGYCVVTLKLKEAFERHALSGVEFLLLPSEPTYFCLKPISTVPFDAERRDTKFESACPSCGLHAGIFGATPAFLLQAPQSDIAGTDVFFGSGNARHPLLIATERTKTLLAHERLTGLTFRAAHV